MKNIEYQEAAIEEITSTALRFLSDKYRAESTIIFKAPTGSGKTFIISQTLKQIVKKSKMQFSFIWISVNSLHEQSKQNLTRYLEDERLLECIGIEDIRNKSIEQNEIVFINWDSLIKDNNIFRMDNEIGWNLESVVSNTKEEDREIILIIDESHRTAKAEKAKDVIKEIAPRLIIEMTATPLEKSGHLIDIPIRKVIDQGMIKKEVQINPGAKKIKENKELLEIALKKRIQLKKAYESIGLDINPLLLIQIPNKRMGDSTAPEAYMMSLLAEQNVTISNGKLCLRLSGENIKELDELIKPNNSEVDVLIFKEAIAVGWDCPRAAILFLQREWKQERYIFNVQTLGRILRMPDQIHYYEKPELNIGYVFSASDNFEIVQELASDFVSRLQMNRDEDLYEKPLKLHSEYIRRKRELTRLSSNFKKCLFESSIELNTKDEVNQNIKEISKTLAVEGKVEDIDEATKVSFEENIKIKKDIREVVDSYTYFCSVMSSPYAKNDSSSIIKSSIRSWFKETFNQSDEDMIALIVMNKNNNPKFKLLIEKAKEKYSNLPKRSDEIIPVLDWEVPSEIPIFTDYVEIKESDKSVIKQMESRKLAIKLNVNSKLDLSNPEYKFITELDRTDDYVLWWFKNSYGESKYFGIVYKNAKGLHYSFYPDFIIKTKKEVLIIEIKDNNDFKPENLLKLQAGRNYLIRNKHKERIYFNIISPNDFESFFQLIKTQDINKFNSLFELNLIRFNKSQQVLLNYKGDKTTKDIELLAFLEELDNIIYQLKNKEDRNILLNMGVKEAQDLIKTLTLLTSKENIKTE
jgi:type III restriction enzyme